MFKIAPHIEARAFGALVRAARMAHRQTQADLAAACSLTKAGVSSIERGEDEVPPATVKALCAALPRLPRDPAAMAGAIQIVQTKLKALESVQAIYDRSLAAVLNDLDAPHG